MKLLSAEQMGILRRKVRDALLAVSAGRRCTLGMIDENVRALTSLPFTAPDLRQAIAWNEDKGFISEQWNHDFDREEYELTNRGRAKDAA